MLLTAAGTVMADNPKFDAFGNLIIYADSDNGTGSDNSNDSNHDNGTGSDNSNDSNHDGGSDHGNDGGNDNDHDG